MKKLFYFSTTALIVLAFSSQIFAQSGQRFMGKRGMRPERQGPILHMLKANQEELKLTDSQLDKIKTLALEKEELQLKCRNELNLQRLEMKKLLLDRENLDYAQLKSQMTKSSELRTTMFIEGLKTRDKINSILTPEQQQVLKNKRGNMLRSKRFSDRMGRMNRGSHLNRTMRPRIRR